MFESWYLVLGSIWELLTIYKNFKYYEKNHNNVKITYYILAFKYQAPTSLSIIQNKKIKLIFSYNNWTNICGSFSHFLQNNKL